MITPRRASLLAAALLGAACAPAPASTPMAVTPAAAVADPCATAPVTPAPDTVRIGLAEPVDPVGSPARGDPALGDAERLLQRQLDPAPFRVRCHGDSVPVAAPAFRIEAATTGALIATPLVQDLPVLAFRRAPGIDPRDLLDQGADLLVTRDPATIDYAARLADFRVVELPWDRIYVAVTRRPVVAAGTREAVRADARPASVVAWWDGDTACTGPAWSDRPAGRRVVYPAGDPTAHDLATRLVATGTGAAAVALAPGELAAALAGGSDAAYVVPLPLRRVPGCDALPRRPAGAVVTPLVETRAHALMRNHTVRISADADGTVRIVAPGPP